MEMHLIKSSRNQVRTKTLTSNIFGYFLPIFVVSAMTLSYLPGLSKVTIIIGFTISILYLLYHLSSRKGFQPEFIIYFSWVCWSLTGAFVCVNQEAFWNKFSTIFQISIMIFIISGITYTSKNLRINVFSLLLGITVLLIISFYKGEINLSFLKEQFRLGGVIGNANMFAFHMLFGIWSILYSYNRKMSTMKKMLIVSIITVLSIMILLTGSRKSFLAEILFFNILILYNLRANVKRVQLSILGSVFMAVIIFYFVDYTLKETYMGERLLSIQKDYEEGHSIHKRQQMYKVGFEIIDRNPILGIGIGNYYWLVGKEVGGYSHSDFIEVGSGTGIVGLLIYYSIYIVIWHRLSWIRKNTSNPRIQYHIALFKASIIVIFLLGLGAPYYYVKIFWIYLASVFGYTRYIEHRIQSILSYKKDVDRA